MRLFKLLNLLLRNTYPYAFNQRIATKCGALQESCTLRACARKSCSRSIAGQRVCLWASNKHTSSSGSQCAPRMQTLQPTFAFNKNSISFKAPFRSVRSEEMQRVVKCQTEHPQNGHATKTKLASKILMNQGQRWTKCFLLRSETHSWTQISPLLTT